MTSKYHGHLTREDGSHVPLTEEQANALWDAAMAQKEARAEQYPTVEECMKELSTIRARLDDLGWRDPMYCPKDGTYFDAIEFGCTSIFNCWYEGEWPRGSWNVSFDGDVWGSRPIAFKLKPDDTTTQRLGCGEG